MSVKQTILFDIGNVLIFFSHEKMCYQLAKVFGLSPSYIYEKIFLEGIGKDYEVGNLSTLQIYQSLQKEGKKSCEFHEFTLAVSDIFELNQEILPILEELKRKKRNLALLSNTCELHYDFIIDRFPFIREFSHSILSFKEGYRKPDPKIYQIALNKLEAEEATCFYIDDLQENVDAAQKLDITSHHFKNNGNLYQALKNHQIL